MNGQYLDNETIINNMGGECITEDGIYLESAFAPGNVVYAYPNKCGKAEAEVIKKSLSQLCYEDEKIQQVNQKAWITAIVFSAILTGATTVLAIMSKNIWAMRVVCFFWISAYINGFFRESALYYGKMFANWSLRESKKYNYAFAQVINTARKKKDIPTYEEAHEESAYMGEEITSFFADSVYCFARSTADTIVLLGISTCLNMLWQGNNNGITKFLLSALFLIAGAVMMYLHKDFIRDWIDSLKSVKWFIALAERPFLSKPEYKHYDTAISALRAHCARERYIDEHIEDYQIDHIIFFPEEGKMIITLVNGDKAIIYV